MIWRKLLSLMLSMALIISLNASLCFADKNKISDELLQYQGDDVVEAIIYLNDISNETAYEVLRQRYPEEYEQFKQFKESEILTPVNMFDEEIIAAAANHKRDIYYELYGNQNSSFLLQYVTMESCMFLSHYSPMLIVKTTMNVILEMAKDSRVVWIERNVEEEHEDAGLALANILSRAGTVRDTYGNSGTGVKIGMYEIDGVPNTNDTLLSQATIYKRYGTEPTTTHATIVAKIMVASNSSVGNNGFAPNAKLYCCCGSSNVEFYGGIEWMIDSGVNIINASVDFGEDGTYGQKSKWVDHIAVKHDVHFVTTAGNTDNQQYSAGITAPGMAYNAITVGAFDPGTATSWDQVTSFALASFTRYQEGGTEYCEKPNIVADGMDFWGYNGTSYASPQVAATIAQMCSYNLNLRYKQTSVGAMLMAAAAHKVDSFGTGLTGDIYGPNVCVAGSNQISEYEGAGILDSQWAREIISSGNYWSASVSENSFPYSVTTSITATQGKVVRVCLFWLRQNSVSDHSSGGVTVGAMSNLDLYVYNQYGTLVASSSTIHSNFEIVQFVPTVSGTYTIQIQDSGGRTGSDYIGIAMWSGFLGT